MVAATATTSRSSSRAAPCTDEWADGAAAIAGRPASGCSRAPRVVGDGERARFPAEPPDTKQPPAVAGSPVSVRSQSRAASSAATAAPASCHDSPENDQAPTSASNRAAVVAGAAGM